MARHRRIAHISLLALATLAVLLRASPATPLSCLERSHPSVWPPQGRTIDREPRILLHGCGEAAIRVDTVADRGLWLVAEGAPEVRLRLLERHAVSAACARQVLLGPELPLEPGRTYELRNAEGRPFTIEDDRGDGFPVRWPVGAGAGEAHGEWSLTISSRRCDSWGCSVTLATRGLPHQGTELLRVVLVPDGLPGVQEALVPLDFGQAFVQSGGCGGDFDLDPGMPYAAVVQLLVPGGRPGGTRFLDLGVLREAAESAKSPFPPDHVEIP